ncbi:SapC family protein [Sphingomonas sp. PB4P5]|uniref:SapC family protein n=1 Tax=Parasphingomonas puruogangriensis TaxID=3096155 RepID=UPI002FCBB5CF
MATSVDMLPADRSTVQRQIDRREDMADTSTTSQTAQDDTAHMLVPLTAELHGRWRIAKGDFGHASDTPFVPVLLAEFAAVARTYPIVFSATDPSPMALLGLERANLFVSNGAWDAEQVATGGPAARPSEAYVPAYIRRHPFALLRTPDDRHVLAIDPASALLRVDGEEGEPMFVEGSPSPTTQSALAFCEAFRLQADSTIEFVKALEARELLVERQAQLVLNNGRNLGLTGLRVVDERRFVKLDGPTIVEWHAKGWLAPIHFHLASLDRFGALARRQAFRDETETSGADATRPGAGAPLAHIEPVA